MNFAVLQIIPLPRVLESAPGLQADSSANSRRIELFCALPIEKLDRLKLEQLTGQIGSEDQGMQKGNGSK